VKRGEIDGSLQFGEGIVREDKVIAKAGTAVNDAVADPPEVFEALCGQLIKGLGEGEVVVFDLFGFTFEQTLAGAVGSKFE
jgi:hypothetical protein